jgi:hypothetical protein
VRNTSEPNMSIAAAELLTIAVGRGVEVSGLLQTPHRARVCYVLAHGAGAGMTHPFMAAVAAGLAERGIATLRYQFPYMERGSKRPDPPKLAQATVCAAVAAAQAALPGLSLIAGGKSFGGRMTSQAQAAAPLAWSFSVFRCMRPGSRQPSAASICSAWKCRCCFCKALGTRWRPSMNCSRCARGLVGARR